MLKDLFDFVQSLEQVFPKLVKFLTSDKVVELFEKYQASAYQLAQIVDFCLHFDMLKMSNPNIQNDFSYYRRSVSRMKMGNNRGEIVVNDELANRMSLFFAHSSPVSKALTDSLTQQITMKQLQPQFVVDAFSVLAGVAYNTIKRKA